MALDIYQYVQSIAKQVHTDLESIITAESCESSIALKAVDLLKKYGINDTWYHDVPAFVLLGSNSCLSISGKDYTASSEPVGLTNLVTVDLSPMLMLEGEGAIWGDCARSFCIEKGQFTSNPTTLEFVLGQQTEQQLHKMMQEFVTVDTTFAQLYEFGNQAIQTLGFENLDFLNNLGHSIENNPDNRKYIDQNCHDLLSDARFFTFEPHIKQTGKQWGFKHEDIYYFDEQGNVITL